MILEPKSGVETARIDEIKKEIYYLSNYDYSVMCLKLFLPAVLWSLATILICYLFCPHFWSHGNHDLLMMICAFVPSTFLFILSVRRKYALRKPCWKSMLRELDQMEDVNVTILLLDLIKFNPYCPEARKTFRPILAHKLPELQCADAFRVGNYHRALLYEELKAGDGPMTLAVLQTIERMTWVDALPHIRGLARGKGIAQTNHAVHEAAQSCEQALQLVVDRFEVRQTLLRASSPAQAPGELLRAADSTRSTPEADAQLLRPTLGQEETAVQ